MELAIGRLEYSGISERGKADGNLSLTRNLNKVNSYNTKWGKEGTKKIRIFPVQCWRILQIREQGKGEGLLSKKP